MSKAERRAAGKAARLAAARRRKRMRFAAWAGTGLLVAGVIIGVFWLVGGGDGGSPSTPAAAKPCGEAAFPPVPADADPTLCTKPTVTAGTGELTELKVTTLVEGKGAAVASGQTITVNYVGVSFRSGEEFDASWNSQRPYPFKLGAREVIAGWDQGLVGVKVGSRVQLDLPASLAYGDSPAGDQPGGPLRFVVDVLSAA